MAEQGGKSRLDEIADELQQAQEKIGQPGWTYQNTLQVGSRLLIETIREGAFSDPVFEDLRFEIDHASRYPEDPGSTLVAAYEWLTRNGFLFGEVGGELSVLEQLKIALPELIRGEAAKLAGVRQSSNARPRQFPEQGPADTTGLKPCEEKAYQSCRLAESKMQPPPKTDQEAYDWLRNNFDGLNDYNLPTFDTWQRHVRAGRRCYGAQKNTPRHARPTGRNVAKSNEI